MISKTPKGGTRPGAGRPKVEGRFMQLRLSEQEIERARVLGDGNVSLGVRRALADSSAASPSTTIED